MSKKISKLKMLVVDKDGNGQGLENVTPKEASYANISKIIGGFEVYPFKMVYKGKKYWMICDGNGMMKYQEHSWFTPFTSGMMDIKFVYNADSRPAHPEDLQFNGIVKVKGMGYAINTFGPMVFLEDVDEQIVSEYWQDAVAV